MGVGGSLTGTAVDIAIIDDPVKDAVEAFSPTYRARVWDWYNSVLTTRLHNNSKQLFIMTRWHEDDLAGRILKAEAGEVQAMTELGSMYMYEILDYDKAEEWMIKAVEAGDSASFTRALLGDLYSGVGGSNKTDFEKAIEWYTKSMEVDDPSPYGVYQLGNIYYQGYGGETDYEKAFELFNRAVEIWKAQNSTDAIFPYTVEQIGDMYSNGRGVEKDTDKAAEYYKWADELNSG